MTIRRASVILPCRRLDDFPTHLTGPAAADLLAAVTGLWHPSLIHATQALPGLASGRRTAGSRDTGWRTRCHSVGEPRTDGAGLVQIDLQATVPRNPPPVDAVAISQR